MSSLFGRLVGAHHVEDATVNVLRLFYATYLHEAERVSDITPGSLELPRSIRVSSEQETMPEDQTPSVTVSSPGVLDIPGVSYSRQYTARWEIEVGVKVSAIGIQENGAPRALRLARIHALAVRGCLVQQPGDSGYLFRRDWIGEAYDTLPSIDDRTICIGRVRMSIEVPDVLTSDAGPIEPIVSPDPPDVTPPAESPEWPTAVMADVDLVKVPEEDLP
jgi:hypothetical protein